MEMRITHREEHPGAGFGVQVRFQDPSVPVLQVSSASLAGVPLILEHLVQGRHPRTTNGRRDCALCRQEGVSPQQRSARQ